MQPKRHSPQSIATVARHYHRCGGDFQYLLGYGRYTYAMTQLDISPALVGRKVCNPARPEWGEGTVLRVQSTTVDGQPRHRVSVQFAVGHRMLQVPPARLADPEPEPQRAPGWLAAAAADTLDDRLRRVPNDIVQFLGVPARHLVAFAPLYVYTEQPASLAKWARSQTGVADPLSHWSRDELQAAFRKFCDERDAAFRVVAARLKQAEGSAALEDAVAAAPEEVRGAMRQALQRPI